MKRLVYILSLIPCLASGLDRTECSRLLDIAAATNGAAYLNARNRIVQHGPPLLPILAASAMDSSRTWQQRLAARICYERIVSANEIDQLRKYDWRTHPEYNRMMIGSMLGAGADLAQLGVKKCSDAGLWYYYIELFWKRTNECADVPIDSSINK